MRERIVVDTNVLMQIDKIKFLEEFIKENEVIITHATVQEIDNHNHGSDNAKTFKARIARNFMLACKNKINFINQITVLEGLEKDKPDNLIISCAKEQGAKLFTLDLFMILLADQYGVEVFQNEQLDNDVLYNGCKVVTVDYEDEVSQTMFNYIFENPSNNVFGLKNNQYCLIKDKNKPLTDKDGNNDYEVVMILKWNGNKMVYIKYNPIKIRGNDEIKPRNIKQKLLFDLMQDNQSKIKLCIGSYGSGKDYIQLSHCMDAIDKGKYSKLIWLRSNCGVKGIDNLGYLPGNMEEKLEPYTKILDDILGGEDVVDSYKLQDKLKVEHIGFIRGRSFTDSILYCTEAQNLPISVIKLIISRLGEGSILVLNGDFEQVDKVQHQENSLQYLAERLKGQDQFAMIELDKVERSELANLARLL